MSEVRHTAAWQRFHFISRTSLSPRLTITSKGIQASALKNKQKNLLYYHDLCLTNSKNILPNLI